MGKMLGRSITSRPSLTCEHHLTLVTEGQMGASHLPLVGRLYSDYQESYVKGITSLATLFCKTHICAGVSNLKYLDIRLPLVVS